MGWVICYQFIEQIDELFGGMRQQPCKVYSFMFLKFPVLGFHVRGMKPKLLDQLIGRCA